MPKPKVIILTDKNGFFGQTRKPWVSIDTSQFIDEFRKAGFGIKNYTFDEILNNDIKIENSVVIYTFSQKFYNRSYINDVIYALSQSNTVIPSYEMLKCHENKGFQEIVKKELGIDSLKSFYFSDPAFIDHDKVNYPVVLKSVSGSNGKQVWLANNRNELESLIKKYFIKIKLSDRIDLLRRKYFRKKKFYKEYPDYSNKTDLEQYSEYITTCRPFILQEFIEGLEYDYRVLVLNDKYYVTKRHVKTGDFRASGAKKFDFDFTPGDGLMKFAENIHTKLGAPLSSLDICEKNGKYFLIEFQALHFGINVFVKSNRYFIKENDSWIKKVRNNNFETELAEAFINYITEKL